MTDSTQVILPAAQAFISGRLELNDSISSGIPAVEPTWADCPSNYITVIVFTVLAIITLKSLMSLYPFLLDSFTRWKGCVSIDSSIRLKSDRNLLGLIWVLPIIMVYDRYDVFSADFIDGIKPEWHILASAGMIAGWLAVRFVCFSFLSLRAAKAETFKTAHKSLFNFLILLSSLLILSVGIFSFTTASSSTSSMVILGETLLLLLVSFTREYQILRSFCSPFRSFLYLCGLEFIPVGALVAVNILL